jgi:hypothetical protein
MAAKLSGCMALLEYESIAEAQAATRVVALSSGVQRPAAKALVDLSSSNSRS